ncbi:hypothetical protein F5Y16DRAFT_420459 [Xylariaceae sp. FL0255]|nr:hypothetical protein F5Y16DRAFT_420459 [Xylariaceae sp. FL0255]
MAATNTAALLPLIPRIFFVYLEPPIIIAGMMLQYAATEDLLQVSSPPLKIPVLVGPGLSSGYLLLIMLYGLIVLLVAPPSKRLAQLHIGILIAADFVHWGVLFYTMARADPRGWAVAFDINAWDDETRTLVYGPAATFTVKVLTLAGVFGKIKG